MTEAKRVKLEELTPERLDELEKLREPCAGHDVKISCHNGAHKYAYVSALLWSAPELFASARELFTLRESYRAQRLALAEAEQRGAERERAKNYATERQARQELWSFIRLHAGMYELQAASVEWLDAWAPELISGRYADIGSGRHLKGEE